MYISAGIDVSKETCNIALLNEKGGYTETVFENNDSGVKELKIFIKRKGVSKETPFVLESTGSYHLLFAMALKDTHFRGVKVINPILTKKYQKSSVRKIKTDKADARMLALMGKHEELQSFEVNKTEILQRKRITLLRKLEQFQQQLTSTVNEFYETTKKLDLDQSEASGSMTLLKAIKAEIKVLEKSIIESEQTELAKELSSIKGVSSQNAAILSYFLNTKKFESRDQIAAFAGLDLTVKESGTSVHGKRKISKRGDSYLRKKLFNAAWGLFMHDPIYRAYYDKKRDEGKHYYTCLTAISRKFTRHIFAIKRRIAIENEKLLLLASV